MSIYASISDSTGGGKNANSFVTDSGTAVPVAGVINIITDVAANNAGSSVEFVGSGNTVQLNVTDGSQSTAIGQGAGGALGPGSQSTVVGYHAGAAQGGNNVFVGNLAGNLATSTFNVGIGQDALSTLQAGSGRNTACGWNSLGLLNTGSYCIGLGYDAGNLLNAAESSVISIGHPAVAGVSNAIYIGQQGSSAGQQNAAFFSGISGNTSTSSAVVVGLNTSTQQLLQTTITAGTGITVTPSGGAITISAMSTGTTWSVITANQTAAVSHGYFCNKAGTLALALPATSAVGDIIEVSNINTATGTQFTQAAGQQIFIANTSTTLGATGTLTSTALGDSLKLVCSVANTIWNVVSMIGSWTVV